MHKNLQRLWVILLVASGLIALWFSATAAGGLWKFFCLNARAQAQVLHWQVQELSSSRFALEAEYQFKLNGKTHNGKTIIENPQFLNRFAAENYMVINSSKSWVAWYRSSDPSYSSLEKILPKKKCLQALLTIGVFIYFFFAKSLLVKLASPRQ